MTYTSRTVAKVLQALADNPATSADRLPPWPAVEDEQVSSAASRLLDAGLLTGRSSADDRLLLEISPG